MNVPSTIAWQNQNGQSNPIGRHFVMTVDVDGWSSLLRFYSIDHDPLEADSQVNVEDGILRLLQLFKEHELRATFFVTGEVAQKHSGAIRKISKEGHEVACHGLTHEKNECLFDETSQRRKIGEATRIIEERTGRQPKGFRAPCLRSNETTLKILDEWKYVYDSSVIPTFVPGYYGSPMAPLKPYHPSASSIGKRGSCKVLEMPVSVNPMFPLPLSAAWMRNLGFLWVKFGIKMNFVLGNPVVFYVHPRDVVSLPKVEGVPWHLYRNVGDSTMRMLGNMIKYAAGSGASFVRASDLAQLLLSKEGC
jgi:peptidoglycan/xylan/chitin deacetylase (PgdA/CDA1 family)